MLKRPYSGDRPDAGTQREIIDRLNANSRLTLTGGQTGISNSLGTVVIPAPQKRQYYPQAVSPVFLAMITGHTAASSSSGCNQYLYSWVAVTKSGSGYDGTWTSTGTSGTTGSSPAYNLCEVINSGTEPYTLGNGVFSDNLIGSYSLRACPDGVVVLMKTVPISGGKEYWFQYENGVDGDCPT